VNVDLSVWQLILGASPLVKGVMLLLLGASLFSWTYIFQRFWYYRQQSEALTVLENLFRREDDAGVLLAKVESTAAAQGVGRVLREGLQAVSRLKKLPPKAREGRVLRSMQSILTEEVENLQKHLSFLATVSSVSPYIGLFGTVWGIMNALRALGAVQQATLSAVAPGMAEALIATAMGLFAAIPAAIAYNRYTHKMQSLTARYDALCDSFSEVLNSQEVQHD
tara:strand:+ start:176 stop:844 length:669 start_codon:yes stop_codon:yes gene_type:complete